MLSDELRQFLHGDVADDAATLSAASRDASIFTVRPTAVVYPKDVEDVKNLVKFAVKKRSAGEPISLTARAAGTDMSGGPLNESIIVDFTRYIHRIKMVDTNFAVAEPGAYYRDLEKETDKLGVMMPSYPASKELCAVGGIVANNSGGEKTLAYGKTENYILELKIVLADGEEHVVKPLTQNELKQKMAEPGFEGELYNKLYSLLTTNYQLIEGAKPNVSKNSAGYYLWNVWDKKTFDLTKLIVGSQGTLGLVTEVKLRLVPKPKHSRMLVLFLRDLAPLTGIIETVLKFKPESFESYDDNTLKLAMRFLPSIAKAAHRNLFSFMFRFLPEGWMLLKGGFPKLVLLAEFTGDDRHELDERLVHAEEAVRGFGVPMRITTHEADAEKYWTIRRESFNLLRKHVQGKHTAPFIDDIIVRPERLGEFLPRLGALLKPYQSKMTYTIAGHVGDGNFHIIPLMDLSDPSVRAIIPELSKSVYDLVLEFGGSITAEHNDGLIRSPFLKHMYGEKIYALFEEVKRLFDPQNIFNPGKKVGGDLVYSEEHIASSMISQKIAS